MALCVLGTAPLDSNCGFRLVLCESYGACGLWVVCVTTAKALLGRGMWVFVEYEFLRCTLFHGARLICEDSR